MLRIIVDQVTLDRVHGLKLLISRNLFFVGTRSDRGNRM